MKRTSATALALKALGEPRRVEILELLRERPRSVGEIAERVAVSQQAVSQHLAVLDDAGLVEARREGTRAIYGAVRALVPPLLEDRPLGADVERLAGSLARVVLAA